MSIPWTVVRPMVEADLHPVEVAPMITGSLDGPMPGAEWSPRRGLVSTPHDAGAEALHNEKEHDDVHTQSVIQQLFG